MDTKLYTHISGGIYLGYHFTDPTKISEVERFVGGDVGTTSTGTLVVATPDGAKKLELNSFIVHIPATNALDIPKSRPRHAGDMRSSYQVYTPEEFHNLFKEKR